METKTLYFTFSPSHPVKCFSLVDLLFVSGNHGPKFCHAAKDLWYSPSMQAVISTRQREPKAVGSSASSKYNSIRIRISANGFSISLNEITNMYSKYISGINMSQYEPVVVDEPKKETFYLVLTDILAEFNSIEEAQAAAYYKNIKNLTGKQYVVVKVPVTVEKVITTYDTTWS